MISQKTQKKIAQIKRLMVSGYFGILTLILLLVILGFIVLACVTVAVFITWIIDVFINWITGVEERIGSLEENRDSFSIGRKNRDYDLVDDYPSLDPADKTAGGFWAYWNPHIIASGDTFVIVMGDSLWMTGDAPEAKGISWCGWMPWGRVFWLR